MGVLAARFTELKAKAGKPVKGDIRVNTNLPAIITMKCVEVGTGKQKKELLVMEFECKTVYQPMGAEIELKGELTYVADDPKKIFNLWTKEKKMEEQMSLNVLNFLIKKCSIESIKVADDMDLPVPVKLPEVRAREDKK